MFACEFWEIFNSTFFTEHLWATASELTHYNPGHNIFELDNVLLQVRLATNKTELSL